MPFAPGAVTGSKRLPLWTLRRTVLHDEPFAMRESKMKQRSPAVDYAGVVKDAEADGSVAQPAAR